jgi:hypothetical protein
MSARKETYVCRIPEVTGFSGERSSRGGQPVEETQRKWVESLAMTEAVSNARRIGLMNQPEIARRRRLAKRATATRPLPRSARLAGSGVCTEVVRSNVPLLPPLSVIFVCESKEYVPLPVKIVVVSPVKTPL